MLQQQASEQESTRARQVDEQVCGSIAGFFIDAQFSNNIGPNALGYCREVVLKGKHEPQNALIRGKSTST